MKTMFPSSFNEDQAITRIKVLRLPPIRSALLIFAALMLMQGMHLYFRDVIIPTQEVNAAARNRPRGNNSDLYPRWLAARELLLHHRDPYTDEFTAEIQRGYWGRTLDANNPDDPKDAAGFAYPLYVIFFLAPTITLPFASVQRLYFVVALALSIASIFFWARSFGSSGATASKIVAAILFVGCYPVVQGFYLQQPVLVVAALIAATMSSIVCGRLCTAGILLGIAMIKPQAAAPIAAWLLLWSVSDWANRKTLFISFAATMALMCGAAELLLPGWIGEWGDAATAYVRYTEGVPAHVQVLFGRYLGTLVELILVTGAGLLCWRARHDSPSSDRFKLVGVLILVINLAVTPIWHEYDQLFVLPAILLLFHWRDEFQRLHPLASAIVLFSGVAFLWHWIAAIALLLLTRISSGAAPAWQILPWLPIFFAPTLALISLMLMGRQKISRSGQFN